MGTTSHLCYGYLGQNTMTPLSYDAFEDCADFIQNFSS